MQKHAGILFISKKTSKILLVLDGSIWTVPSFLRSKTVVEDSKDMIVEYVGKETKLIPIELYVSKDNGFEFSTYICMVDREFIPTNDRSFCWVDIENVPKGIHTGLKNTLGNKINKTKIDTVLLIGRSQ